jgi:hypothetical protein
MRPGSKRFFFEKKNQKTFIINRSFKEPKPQLVMAGLDPAIHALPAARNSRESDLSADDADKRRLGQNLRKSAQSADRIFFSGFQSSNLFLHSSPDCPAP